MLRFMLEVSIHLQIRQNIEAISWRHFSCGGMCVQISPLNVAEVWMGNTSSALFLLHIKSVCKQLLFHKKNRLTHLFIFPLPGRYFRMQRRNRHLEAGKQEKKDQMLLGNFTTWIFHVAPISQPSFANIHVDLWGCERLKNQTKRNALGQNGSGSFPAISGLSACAWSVREWGKGEGASRWKCQAAEVRNKSVSWQLCTFACLSLYQVLWYSGIESQQQLYVLLLRKI